MNPLHWKREHQVALLCAGVMGTAIGVAIAFGTLGIGWEWSDWWNGELASATNDAAAWYLTQVGLYGLTGAIAGGMPVYIYRLLKA